jgi:amidase
MTFPAGKMMPPDSELYRLTASEVARHVGSGSLTVEIYVRSLLSRIEAREPLVKAWAYLDPTLILEEAQKLDKILPEDRGPLHGIPIGIKDVIYTNSINFQSQVRLTVPHS